MTVGSPRPTVPIMGMKKVSTKTGFVYVSPACVLPPEHAETENTQPDKTAITPNIIISLMYFFNIVRQANESLLPTFLSYHGIVFPYGNRESEKESAII